MWGGETQAGPEKQSPRDRSKGRMRHATKYHFSEDCGRQNYLNGRLSAFGLGREASRLLLLCEEKRIDFARWEPSR
jgi:hypothetical protein